MILCFFLNLAAQDNDEHRTNESTDRFLPTTIKTEIQHSIQSAFQTVNNKPPESGILNISLYITYKSFRFV